MNKEDLRKLTSVKISNQTKEILKQNNYTLGEALEQFAKNLTNSKEQKKLELQNLLLKQKQMEHDLINLQLDIDDLKKDLNLEGIANEDLFNDELINHVQTTLDYFRIKGSSKDTIENFCNNNQTYIKDHADMLSMNADEFENLVISEYHKRNPEAQTSLV